MMVPLFVLGALLLVLVVFAAGMMLQERRSSVSDDVVIYGVDDSVDFVWDNLSPDSRSRVKRSDVRRILEWEMHYLQQPKLRGSDAAVVGGNEAAAYAQERAWEAGYSYEPETIVEVMDIQGRYLLAIGAVGDLAREDAGEEPT